MSPTYDVENGFRELRYAAKRPDPLTRRTVKVAFSPADHLVDQFAGRDLRLVAEALITCAASIGTLTHGDDMGTVAVNVQAFAGLFVLEAHERQEVPDAAATA